MSVWDDFDLRTCDLSKTRTSLKHGCSPLEQLAWAELTTDQFVERLASEVWRRPAYYSLQNGGRVGVSRGKTRRFVMALGKHFSPQEKKEIIERVFERAQELFERACKIWAHKALEMSVEDTDDEEVIPMSQIKACVQVVAPKGARGKTLDIIRTTLCPNCSSEESE
jgi:hypothetical protein